MKVYRFLAYLITVEVIVQAASIALALYGLGKWVDDEGGVLNKAVLDEGPEFTGVVGFPIHGINGMMIIPLLALLLLITSFFAKIAGGTKWALLVLLLVVVQVALGLIGHSVVWLGPLHAINAFLLMGAAAQAGRRARKTAATAPDMAMA